MAVDDLARGRISSGRELQRIADGAAVRITGSANSSVIAGAFREEYERTIAEGQAAPAPAPIRPGFPGYVSAFEAAPPAPPPPPRYVGPQVSLMEAAPPRYGAAEGETGALFGDVEPAPVPWQLAALPIAVRYQGDAIRGLELAPNLVDLAGGVLPVPLGSEAAAYYPTADEADQDDAALQGVALVQVGQPVDESAEVSKIQDEAIAWENLGGDQLRTPPPSLYLLLWSDEYSSPYQSAADEFFAGRVRASRLLGAAEVEALAGQGLFFHVGALDPKDDRGKKIPAEDLALASTSPQTRRRLEAYGLTLHRLDVSPMLDARRERAEEAEKERAQDALDDAIAAAADRRPGAPAGALDSEELERRRMAAEELQREREAEQARAVAAHKRRVADYYDFGTTPLESWGLETFRFALPPLRNGIRFRSVYVSNPGAWSLDAGPGLVVDTIGDSLAVVSRKGKLPELAYKADPAADQWITLGEFASAVQAREIGRKVGHLTLSEAKEINRAGEAVEDGNGKWQARIDDPAVSDGFMRFYQAVKRTAALRYAHPVTLLPAGETTGDLFRVEQCASARLERYAGDVRIAMESHVKLPDGTTESGKFYDQISQVHDENFMPTREEMAPVLRWLIDRHVIAVFCLVRAAEMRALNVEQIFRMWPEYTAELRQAVEPSRYRREAARKALKAKMAADDLETAAPIAPRPSPSQGLQLPSRGQAHGYTFEADADTRTVFIGKPGAPEGEGTVITIASPGEVTRALGALVRVLEAQSEPFLRGMLRPGRMGAWNDPRIDLYSAAAGYLNELDDRLIPNRKSVWQSLRSGPLLAPMIYRPKGSVIAVSPKAPGEKDLSITHMPTGMKAQSAPSQPIARKMADWMAERHPGSYEEKTTEAVQAATRQWSGAYAYGQTVEEARKKEATEKKAGKFEAPKPEVGTSQAQEEMDRISAEVAAINRENAYNTARHTNKSPYYTGDGTIRLAIAQGKGTYEIGYASFKKENILGFFAARDLGEERWGVTHIGTGLSVAIFDNAIRGATPRLAAINLAAALDKSEPGIWTWGDLEKPADQVRAFLAKYDMAATVERSKVNARKNKNPVFEPPVERPARPEAQQEATIAKNNREVSGNKAPHDPKKPPKYEGDPGGMVNRLRLMDRPPDQSFLPEKIRGFFGWKDDGANDVAVWHLGTGRRIVSFGPDGISTDNPDMANGGHGPRDYRKNLAAKNVATMLDNVGRDSFDNPWTWGDVRSHEKQLEAAGKEYDLPASFQKAASKAIMGDSSDWAERRQNLARSENPRRTPAKPAQGPDLAARRAARPAAERAARHIRENVDAFYGDRISYEDFGVGQRQIYDSLSPVESLAVSAILRGDLAWFEGRTENPAATVRNPGKDVAAWVARCREGKAQIRAFEMDARAVADRLLQIKRAELVDARVKACDAPRAEVKAKFDRQIAQLQREAQRLEAQARKADQGEKAASRGKLPRLPRGASDALIEGSLMAMEPRLVPAWRKAAGMIEGDSPSQRLEVFLHYAADNPGEVTAALAAAGPELAKQLEGLPPLRLAGLEAAPGALEAPATPAAPLLAPVPETDTFYRAILPQVLSDGGRYLVRLLLGVPDYTATEGDLYAAFSQAFPGDDQAWWTGIQQIAGLSLDTSPIAVEQIGADYDTFRLIFSRVDAPPDPPETPPPPPAPADAPPQALEGEPPAVLVPQPEDRDDNGERTPEGARIFRNNAIVRARVLMANLATVEGVIDLARRLMEQKAAIRSRDVHKTMGERADLQVLAKLGLDPSKTLAPAVVERLVSLGFTDDDARSLVGTQMATVIRPGGPQGIQNFLQTMRRVAQNRLYGPSDTRPRPAPVFGRSLVPSTDPPPEAPTAAALGVPVSMDDLDRQEAERAYQHTSHTPERRGDEDRREYVRHMEGVARELRGLYPNATAEELRVQLDGYRTGYLSRLRHYHYTHSNAASTMITGRSGVNVRQLEKRSNAADQALATLRDYSERVRAAWRRDANKASGSGPIRADQANAVELLKEKLKEARRQRASLPEIRQIARDRKASVADKEARLVALGLSASTARELVASGARINSAGLYGEINRLEGRIQQLEKEKARATAEYETTMPSADGSRAYPVRVVDNAEDNRIQLFFSERIDAATAGKLKGRGFKWAPSVQGWQRQRTDNARRALDWGLGIKLPAPSAPAAAPEVEAQGDAELARQAIDEWAGQQAQAAAERQAAELAPAAPVADPMGPETPTSPEGEAQAMAQAQERAKQARAAASDPQAAVRLEREKLERMRKANAILRRTPFPALYSKEWGERVAELYALGIPPKSARNLASPMFGKLPGYDDLEFKMAENRLARLASRTENPSRLAPQKEAAALRWGKRLPEAVYVHRSGREDLPPVMRQALERAREVAGRVSFDVVKFSTVAPVVSLLSYPRFFEDARPALEQSVTVHLDTDEVRRHAYRGRKAPVIHKKHLMLPPERTENPSRQAFPSSSAEVAVWNEDGKIKVRAPYNQAFIAGALQIGGRYNKTAGWWFFPADAGPKVRGLVAQLGRTPNPCACSLDPY